MGSPEVLEGAHVYEHAQSGLNRSDNGFLLRADLHLLFDNGSLRIHPDTLEISIDESIAEANYRQLDGTLLRPRKDGKRPL